MRSAAAMAASKQLRCAIYTRKSTEDGLEQAFNSLDAQREACGAYILSQAGEGWTASPELYDDGGISGGTMERPALKRLLADVQAGRIQIIVVYKVDRLTRSLADFAKIVEILDAAGASFVSVTQAFNTTNSMGRLTLNVLLSFAQFEREVTGERIRDKIAASKKKGMWMGGSVPLGYDVIDRKLVVNDAEAETVRHLMRQYLAAPSVRVLIEQLAAEGRRTKLQIRTSGPHRGGIPFGRGCIYHMLRNRIYLGDIVHKGAVYPGAHEAIVPQDLWAAVQDKLAGNGPGVIAKVHASHTALLTGILFDGLGRRMTPSQANKQGKRYRYYVTMPTEPIDKDRPAWRVPAHDLERIVVDRLIAFLVDPQAVLTAIESGDGDAGAAQVAIAAAQAMSAALRGARPDQRHKTVHELVAKVRLNEQQVEFDVRLGSIVGADTSGDNADAIALVTISAPIERVRRGHEIKLVIPGVAGKSSSAPNRNERLVRLLGEAHTAREALLTSPDTSIEQLAERSSACRKRLTKLIRLSSLAPSLVQMLLEGRQPQTLTPQRLLDTDLPLHWAEQPAAIGIR